MICYDLAHVAEWEPYNLHDQYTALVPGLELYHTDPAQHIITAGDNLDDLDDLSDLSYKIRKPSSW